MDICTDIDVGAEKIIIDSVENEFPNHSIFSEEKGILDKKSDFRWVIDPLDGTKEYIRNVPLFSTVIALEYQKEMILSVVNHVSNNFDTFSAIKGMGSYRNHKKIKVSSHKSINNSYLYYHTPNFTLEKKYAIQVWKKIVEFSRDFYRIRGMAHENIILGWLASGGAEAYIFWGGDYKKGPKWYDIAPGILIAIEAGGIATNLKSEKIVHENLYDGIVVTNGKIHQELINSLKNLKQ